MRIKPLDPQLIDTARFAAKVRIGLGGCHIWTGARTPKGYGRFLVNGSHHMAHRVAYVLAGRTLGPDLVIDHLCRNTSCVNPDHLEAVTTQENTARGNAGINTRSRTHCPQGHAYTVDNTLVSCGRRHCRRCRANRRSEAARKARERYWAKRGRQAEGVTS